jgi:GT2 family glycosyltransferase
VDNGKYAYGVVPEDKCLIKLIIVSHGAGLCRPLAETLYLAPEKKADMQRNSTPFISVITLNYNQTDVTCAFLESTRAWTYPHYEILVCDMASAIDPSEKILGGNYPNTRLLLSDKNLGFAGGNNWGMRQAKGDLFFIVNNDTEVIPDVLVELLIRIDGEESICVSFPFIIYFDHRDTLQ